MLIPKKPLLIFPALLLARTVMAQPALTVNDFQCFVNKYVVADPYANCDGSTAAPVLTANDFQCFLNKFAAGDLWADCDQSGAPPVGWTDLGVAELKFYVSPTGSDSNPGTQAAPFRTVNRGYQSLRDGHRDWLLLAAGGVWSETLSLNKSANSMTDYQVITSYGTGPRPRINGIFASGGVIRRGVAITELELVGSGQQNGIAILESWGHILLEGLIVRGYHVNIAIQETGPGRLPDIKIRRCLIADAFDASGAHSEGIFMGSCDNWLIEECAFVDNGWLNQSGPSGDGFSHSIYIHQTCGSGTIRGIVSARPGSHGGQQRPGGLAEWNAFFECPIAFYQGQSDSGVTAPVNVCQNSIAIDSRDLANGNLRGQGFVLDAAPVSNTVYRNICAHQAKGTGNVTAFDLTLNTATVQQNLVFDWTYNGACWGTAFQWEGGVGAVNFFGNWAIQPNHGMCVRNSRAGISYHDNTYYTTNGHGCQGYGSFSEGVTGGDDWAWWRPRAVESGSVFQASPTTFDFTPRAFLVAHGVAPGTNPLDTYLQKVRAAYATKSSFDRTYTGYGYNEWAHGVAGWK